MNARDMWGVLVGAPRDARVVLRCEGGHEIDIKSVEVFANMVVITACEDVVECSEIDRMIDEMTEENDKAHAKEIAALTGE